MLAQFQIPEIGYSATSITLSNTELYPYFLRVVSPDSQQAQALAELVQAFGWTYISTIHSDGLYFFFSVYGPIISCWGFRSFLENSFDYVIRFWERSLPMY